MVRLHNNNGKISVVIVYNNLQKMQECEKYIKLQSISDFVEIIAIDNRSGDFSSAAKALNYGAGIAKNPVLVFMHQDMYLWDKTVLEMYYEYLTKHPLDIAGVAGVCIDDNKVHSDIFETLQKLQRLLRADGKVMPVWTLDECMFAMQKSLWDQLKFDEEVCCYWHLYAVEICCHNHILGNQNVVLPSPVCHESLGGSRNITYEKSLKKLIDKYHRKLRYIYAPCTVCRCTRIGYYVYEIKRTIRRKASMIKRKIAGVKG